MTPFIESLSMPLIFERLMSIARVEPLTTARALRGPFDYLIPERLGEIAVGTVLEVPFGRRRITGVVVEIAETTEVPPEKLAEPIRIVGGGTNEDLIDLGRWIAAEYCSTPARGLGLALPPGTGTGGERTRFRVEKLNRVTEAGCASGEWLSVLTARSRNGSASVSRSTGGPHRCLPRR